MWAIYHRYLHSTMYLFQQRKLIGMSYYMLNLHSTMYLFQPKYPETANGLTNIYIPLCIYFNKETSCNINQPYSFTFHYVSISTYRLSIVERLHHWFTFHYVSISTKMKKHPCFQQNNLHSTMYLFQPKLWRHWFIK